MHIASLNVDSTAAGAYQFLSRTWDECAAALSLPDFSPPMQDLAAVFLIRRRGALVDVQAGRIEAAIRKCAREWASLPGSPYGQPTRSMEQALATYRQYGGSVYTSAEPVQKPPESVPIPAGEASAPEQTMAPILVAIGKTFLGGLASGLIDAFTPLAKEKVTKELERHGADSAAATQIVGAVVDAAKAATGLANPAAAVVEAGKAPEAVQRVEADTLDTIDRLAPVLDKMHQWDKDAWAATEASRDAAARRAANDPNDQDKYLTKSIVQLMVAMVFGLMGLSVALKWLGFDIGSIVGTLLTLVGFVGREFSTRYQHRYGTSSSSSAKDVVIGELSRRKQ